MLQSAGRISDHINKMGIAAAERHPQIAIGLLGAALVALNLIALSVHGRWDADYAFIVAFLIQGIIYVFAAAIVQRIAHRNWMLTIVIVVASILRLSLLFEAPVHSTDVYRYVWDGRVQAEGTNPYRYPPANPVLAPLRDFAIYPHINRADYAVTIYPPVAQMAFVLFTRIAETVWAVKFGWLTLEAGMMLVLLRLLVKAGRPTSHLLLYAWHPLPIWEIAGDGHVDAGMVAFLVFALSASVVGRHRLAGLLLAASVLFKPLTLAAFPALWRRWDWQMPLAFVVFLILAYVPYISVGLGVVGFLPNYVSEEGIASGRAFIVLELFERAFGPLPAAFKIIYLSVGAIVLVSISVYCLIQQSDTAASMAARAQYLLFTFLLILSPNYPWYFVVLVPLGCLAPWSPALCLTLLSAILYGRRRLPAILRTF